MKKGYIKPVSTAIYLSCDPLMDQSMGNDDVTNNPDEGTDTDGDGTFTPGDADSKENIWGWDDDSWED